MKLSEMSVTRKVAMTAVFLMLLFLGVMSYQEIGIDTLPRQDVPYVQITTAFPGASSDEIEVDVAKRIEDAVASLDGLKHTTSICMDNVCATTLEFNIGISADQMIHEVREKLNTIADEFPAGVETPQLSKINMNAVAVATMFLIGDRTPDELYEYADDELSDRFSCIQGVGEVRIHGGNEVQLHVVLDQEKLAESGLALPEILSRLNTANVKLPAGRVKEGDTEMNITFDAEFRNLDALRELEVSSMTGKRIYLGDIAEISLKSKELRQEAYYRGERAIQLEIVKKADANTVKVIDEVRRRYDEILAADNLPSGMKLVWFKDSGEFTRAAVKDAWQSIAFGILLTVVILFLFLHDLRTTLAAAISMPVSIIISFIGMRAFGYTFDMMTLAALGCSAGILVSNAVVVLENITRHIQGGKDARIASITGTSEVQNAVAASALTNIVVFVPLAMMSSIVGMIVSPFAGVMVVATIVSLLVSFTLTPMLASIFFAKGTREHGKLMALFFRGWDWFYGRLEAGYDRSIDFTRRQPALVVAVIFAISALLAAYALPRISMGFFPTNDKREVAITLEYPVNSNLEANRASTLAILDELAKIPEVETVTATLGYINAMMGQVSEGVYLTEVNLYLTPKNTRKSIFQVADDLRMFLSGKENLRFAVNIPNPMGTSGSELTAYITGPDMEVLMVEGDKAIDALRVSGASRDLDSSVRATKPRTNITPIRPVLRNLGVSETTLGMAVAGFFDGIEAGTYKVGTKSYDIRVKASEKKGYGTIAELVMGQREGVPLTLEVFANLENLPVAVSVIRQDKQRSVWIYSNCASGKTIGDLMEVLTKQARDLPPGYSLGFNGQAGHMEAGMADFSMALFVAIVLTYLLIAAMMESWLHPFLIMFTVPLGFIGMFFIMAIFGESLSSTALLGGVMMIGIVVNNAILLMDETNVLLKDGRDMAAAMQQATRNKFRPILMTSLASVIGMLPMAFGSGIGSEMRVNCGLGVVGGLSFSAVMTIFLIPAIIFLFSRKKTVESR